VEVFSERGWKWPIGENGNIDERESTYNGD